MTTFTPNFHLKGQCKQALELYARALGARVESLMYYADAAPGDWQVNAGDENLVYHAEVRIGDQRFFASDTNDIDIICGNAQSVVVNFDTADEARAAYALLSEGGTIIYPMRSMSHAACDGCVADRFGMRWELLA